MFQQPGIFNGDCFVLAGEVLYRIPTNGVVEAVIGTVSGLERAQMAGGLGPDAESEIRIVTGDAVYLYDGATVASEAMPVDVEGFTSIEFVLGAWFAIRTDTQEIYYRFIDDVAWAELAFQSAEFKPDKAVCIKRLGDQVVVFGEASTQLFAYTGDTDFPLTPYSAGLTNEIGCAARDSVVRVRDALYFVGDDRQVYALTPGLKPISDPGMTEILRGASPNTYVAWGYALDNHEFYVLATEVGSFIFDRLTGFCAKASTYGEEYWRPWFGVQVADRVLCADGVGQGTVWRLEPDALDDDGDPIIRRFCAWQEIPEGRLEISNVVLNGAMGWAPQFSDRIEATNLWTYSEAFENAAWLKTATLVVTDDAIAAPDGLMSGALVNDPDAADNFLYRFETIANDAATYAVSIYLKQGTAAVTRFDAVLNGGSSVISTSAITWATLAVAGTNPGTLTSAGGGWYRLSVPLTNNESGNTSLQVALRPADITAANTGTCYAWGAQWERGATTTDYILTTGETASRYATLDPKIKVRAYHDGVTPGPWRETSSGALGQYETEARWNRWGQFKAPGALFEFEVSDPVVVRVSGVRANVP